MNNDDLLEVAVGMGFIATISVDLNAGENPKSILVLNPYTECFKEFNPTEGELINWLVEEGFNMEITNDCVEVFGKGCYQFDGADLKENLLQVILQVLEEKK